MSRVHTQFVLFPKISNMQDSHNQKKAINVITKHFSEDHTINYVTLTNVLLEEEEFSLNK